MYLEFVAYVDKDLPPYFDPYTIYHIVVGEDVVGSLIYREGSMNDRYFDGHIGYHIDESYRGHHYAYRACLLLKDMIDVDELIITCDPHNVASIKTIGKLHTQYIETKPIPHYLKHVFTKEEKEKRIYIWKVREEDEVCTCR